MCVFAVCVFCGGKEEGQHLLFWNVSLSAYLPNLTETASVDLSVFGLQKKQYDRVR